MTLKEDLLAELQKLRLSRERPFTVSKPTKTKQSKKDDLLQEAIALLEQLDEEKPT